jgi:hypothetical protein
MLRFWRILILGVALKIRLDISRTFTRYKDLYAVSEATAVPSR